MLTWDDLPPHFPEFPAPERWLPLLQAHARILGENVASVRTTTVEAAEAVFRHYAESLELLRLVEGRHPPGPRVDIGPGGGFPGLVFAALQPDVPITLIEPLKKRARLLELAIEAMALPRASVVALRAEEAGRTALREQASLVVARAVAPLPELLEYCAPLACPGALIALPKGRGLDQEVAAATTALTTLTCVVEDVVPMRPAVSATPHVLFIRKQGRVPAAYPRRPGVPRKRPLGSN
jgi:16S rRNA (guanine527-N7)-methyltransferase